MKKYLFLSFMVLFLSGCITKIDRISFTWDIATSGNDLSKIISGDNSLQVSSGETEYFTWYHWPVALVTEKNKDEIIVMTGDELLYRNEVYGFQVKLGKAWKGVKIYEERYTVFPSQEKTGHPYVSFDMPHRSSLGWWWVVAEVGVMNPSSYEKTYERCKKDPDWFCEPSLYEKAKKNNKYYIFTSWNEQHDAIYETFYPYLECEDNVIDWFSSKYCPSAEKQLFSDWEIFDVK